MVKPTLLTEEEGNRNKKSGFEVSLFPIPLTQEKTIPVPTDWVITIVEPTEQLKQMYIEDVEIMKVIKVILLTNNTVLIMRLRKLVQMSENPIAS